jgi:hypothetical protein
MCRHNEKQLPFENFEFMLGGKLHSDNRRVNLAKQIPREDIERKFGQGKRRYSDSQILNILKQAETGVRFLPYAVSMA